MKTPKTSPKASPKGSLSKSSSKTLTKSMSDLSLLELYSEPVAPKPTLFQNKNQTLFKTKTREEEELEESFIRMQRAKRAVDLTRKTLERTRTSESLFRSPVSRIPTKESKEESREELESILAPISKELASLIREEFRLSEEIKAEARPGRAILDRHRELVSSISKLKSIQDDYISKIKKMREEDKKAGVVYPLVRSSSTFEEKKEVKQKKGMLVRMKSIFSKKK